MGADPAGRPFSPNGRRQHFGGHGRTPNKSPALAARPHDTVQMITGAAGFVP